MPPLDLGRGCAVDMTLIQSSLIEITRITRGEKQLKEFRF